ncbi:hypothetical protein ELS24_10155 [Achromobacter spanius]|uniref:hypothetical protein n=1 Tax=Achromobacter spanius TaxID=217203 RepID=UPI000F8F9DC5|nr:hypothetical protein [Achromobacter spanius]AZS78774.1 hypothetical protein ELS24_10155 [Achromobacter spanius]
MFAVIETKNATHIAIHIPHEGSDKSLPALAAMLENNATFINKGWREIGVVKPEMSIILGDKFDAESDDAGELLIKASSAVVSDDFVIAAPEVFVSNKKAIAKKQEEIDRLRSELQSVKYQLEAAHAQLKEREPSEADEPF